jgi:hypothetical protein
VLPGEPDTEESGDLVEYRARVLKAMLGDRLPALVPYLRYVGIALGLAAGWAVYQLLHTEALLFREVVLVVGLVLGVSLGRFAETTAGEWVAVRAARLAIERPAIPADLTAEFRHAYREDPREAARDRRPAI